MAIRGASDPAAGGWQRANPSVRTFRAVGGLLLLVIVAAVVGMVARGQSTSSDPHAGAPLIVEEAAPLVEDRPTPGEGWRRLASAPLSARFDPLAVWTGTEFLVVGGRSGEDRLRSGAAYDPDEDAWRPVAEAPEALSAASQEATWTGEELLVWGRDEGGTELGLVYDLAADAWARLPAAPVPPRPRHVAVWTGNELLVWGGAEADGARADGAAYDPVERTWRSLPPAPVAGPAIGTWSGHELLVWVGDDDGLAGAAYDPDRDRWRTIAGTEPATGGVFDATLTWADDRAVLCCRSDPERVLGIYEPGSDSWTDVSGPTTVADRLVHTTRWTRTELLVWGGRQDQAVWLRGNGARYDPVERTWQLIPEAVPRTPRAQHAAAWTGDELLVWGGYDGRRDRADGVAFRPDT